MLNEKEILQLIEKGENGFVEFKEADVRPDSLSREIVGFANSQGGVIFLGVSDAGEITGISSDRKFDELLANITRNNVIPAISCEYYEVKVFETSIGVIEVPKGFDKPYQTNDGKYLIRVNSTNRIASQGELLRLFQQAGVFHFDTTAVKNSTASDLNMFKIDNYFSKYGITISDESESERLSILKNSEILTESGEMSVAGALIFAINTPKFMSNSGVSFAKFAGNEITAELITKKDVLGNLDVVIDGTVDLIYTYIPKPSKIEGNKRVDTVANWNAYVFREIISNACIHRNYSIAGSQIRVQMFDDRIEIISPGRLPNTITIEKLKVGVSYSVNPVIVKFMENMGYIDKLGRGIPLVIRDSKRINKKVEFKEIGEDFKVILEL